MRGIDISEWNGNLPFENLKREGIDFVIVRLGWGEEHLDSRFFRNIAGVLFHGLKAGVYYYSYALTPKRARCEAAFMARIMKQCGLVPEKIPMGCFLDMEDGDGWKAERGLTNPKDLTEISAAFLDTLRQEGYDPGLYANLNWLRKKLDVKSLGHPPVWCAQWGRHCDYPDAKIWQFTDSLMIEGQKLDGNLTL